MFYIPHSRYTEVHQDDIDKKESLQLLALSETAGAAIIATKDARQVFITGHCEYDRYTLANEYKRDLAEAFILPSRRIISPAMIPTPCRPLVWRGHANLLFANWLNYFVYQQTPYDITAIT